MGVCYFVDAGFFLGLFWLAWCFVVLFGAGFGWFWMVCTVRVVYVVLDGLVCCGFWFLVFVISVGVGFWGFYLVVLFALGCNLELLVSGCCVGLVCICVGLVCALVALGCLFGVLISAVFYYGCCVSGCFVLLH